MAGESYGPDNAYSGGNGYSGGGGYGFSSGGNGGSDGNDGYDSEYFFGGQGSDLDIATIPLKLIELR